MAVGIGEGTTLTFGTSGFTANLLSIEGPEERRGDIDMSHLGTEGIKPYLPTILREGGDMRVTIQYDPLSIPPIDQDEEVLTIAFRDGSSISFPGYMNAYGGPSVRKEAVMEGTFGIKRTGEIERVGASGTTIVAASSGA